MAVKQTENRRIREAINKRINRQIKAGFEPLTKYKSFFPIQGGGDIIDRRTGLVKDQKRFVAEYVQNVMEAGNTGKLSQKSLNDAGKKYYSRLLNILKDSSVTKTETVKDYWFTTAEEIMIRYLGAMHNTYYISDPEELDRVKRIVKDMKPMQQLDVVRRAGGKSNASKHTVSFYESISEILGVANPDTDTP